MDKMAIGKRLSDREAEDEMSPKNRKGSDVDSLSNSKKRKNEGDDEEIILSPDVLAGMTRSERKRHR